ncbi:MAG: M48 family metalloprotease, partial [Isosphaeraceae bacterium]
PFAWAGLFALVAAVYLVARLAAWLGLSVAFAGWSRCRDGHWTDRARLAWPGRRLAGITLFLVPPLVLVAFISAAIFLPALSREVPFGDLVTPKAAALLVLSAGFLGVMQARSAWERRVNPATALTPRLRLATFVLGGLTLAFWVWVVYSLLARVLIHRGDLEFAFIAGGLLLIVAYRLGGGMIVLRMTGMLRPVPERLGTIVAATARRMGVRTPPVEVLAIPMGTALAAPLWGGRIIVTDAAQAVLGDEELSAICAHELCHLSEPRRVVVARVLYHLVGILQLAVLLLAISLMDRVLEIETGLVLGIGAEFVLIGALVLYTRLHRRMEIRADAMAHQYEGDPGTYARALEKLHEVGALPAAIVARPGAYPDLHDRLMAAGVCPDYPRPGPPPRAPFYLGLLALTIGSVAGGLGLAWVLTAIE